MSITLVIFAVILLISLGITYWAAKHTRTTSDFYAADGTLTAAQNGFALAGDWCSASIAASRSRCSCCNRASSDASSRSSSSVMVHVG